jgi:hypothetical protein
VAVDQVVEGARGRFVQRELHDRFDVS